MTKAKEIKKNKRNGKTKKQSGRPKKYTEVEIMQQKIDKYFKECDDNKEPYTITGLALALDLDRKSINNYEKDSDFFPTIKKAKLRVENYLEKRLINDSSATGIIFNLKNNYGWKDKQENINIGTSYEEYLKKVDDTNEY